ncbi:MAG: NfeD family protein [Elusimicrobiota bacterium]
MSKNIKIFVLLSLILFSPSFLPSDSPTSDKVFYIPVDGEISLGMAGFIKRGVEEASAGNADLIVLGIDTFGGRVDATLEILNHIEKVQDIPVYSFIEDKAWSAGALIAMAGEKIVMKKGSSIGSAAPVAGSGEELSEKYVSALRAKFQSLAEQNNYPAAIAVAMVDKDVEVREAKVEGKTRYLTHQQMENLINSGRDVSPGNLIIEKGKLLNLSFRDAESYSFSSGTEENLKEFLYSSMGSDIELIETSPNWSERLAFFLTGGAVSSLLMSLGFLFIFMELQEPGLGWPGILGISFFALFFLSRHIVHLAQWTDVLLFAIGVILVIMEIFVIPGFGVAGISGGILIIAAIYLSLNHYTLPRYPWEFDNLKINMLMIMGSLIFSSVGSILFLGWLHKIPGLNKLVLTGTLGKKSSEESNDLSDKEEKPGIGDEGIAMTDLRPVGRVNFSGKVLDGISELGLIKKGEKVSIVKVEGNSIFVRRRKEK